MKREGQKETIYRDPFLRQHPEGVATLVRKVKGDRYCEVWEVEFRPGAGTVERKISLVDLSL